MTATEAAFVAKQAAIHKRALRKLLLKVDQTGWVGRKSIETLSINGFVSFGGPRPGICKYNCYRLTDIGASLLREAP